MARWANIDSFLSTLRDYNIVLYLYASKKIDDGTIPVKRVKR